MWEGTIHCGWYHPWPQEVLDAIRKVTEETNKQCSSMASAPSIPSFTLLPQLPPWEIMNCKLKQTCSSPRCFWSWCFITAVEDAQQEWGHRGHSKWMLRDPKMQWHLGIVSDVGEMGDCSQIPSSSYVCGHGGHPSICTTETRSPFCLLYLWLPWISCQGWPVLSISLSSPACFIAWYMGFPLPPQRRFLSLGDQLLMPAWD